MTMSVVAVGPRWIEVDSVGQGVVKVTLNEAWVQQDGTLTQEVPWGRFPMTIRSSRDIIEHITVELANSGVFAAVSTMISRLAELNEAVEVILRDLVAQLEAAFAPPNESELLRSRSMPGLPLLGGWLDELADYPVAAEVVDECTAADTYVEMPSTGKGDPLADVLRDIDQLIGQAD